MRTQSETGLYLTDNGQCLCDDHLGASATMTGRDISGQPIHPVTVSDKLHAARDGWSMSCETCDAIQRRKSA